MHELGVRRDMARFQHDTGLGGENRHFPMTQWTRILDTSQRQSMLAELCERYWKPLYGYLRCKGFSNDQAKDLVQGFFTEKVIDQELIKAADRTKGRFRNFLLVALRNYSINIQKKDKHGATIGLDSPGVDPQSERDAVRLFNRTWAEQVLDRVLEALKQECERKGRQAHWGLFYEWLIESKTDEDKATMEELCAKYDLDTAQQAYKIVCRTKERFRAILRERLRSQVDQDGNIDQEIGEFITAFSKK